MNNKKILLTKKMWYGINASVIIGPGFLHRAGHGIFLLPHPPIVDCILRYGLRENDRNKLSVIHEFAHLKTTPFAIVYTFLVFFVAYTNNNYVGWRMVLFLILSIHTAWEMLSEGVTILDDSHRYMASYEGIPILPRACFWTITSFIVIEGWYFVLL